MRLIDADALRDKWLYSTNEAIYVPNDVLDSIDEAPTVEAAPVRHGEWRGVDEDDQYTDEPCYDYECSVCGDRVHFGESTEKISVWGDFSYCPSCGAVMDMWKPSDENSSKFAF